MSTVPPDLAALASAAEEALTAVYGPLRVTSAQLLPGSGRSRVFRAWPVGGAAPASVIVKAPQTAEPWRERAALRVLGRAGVPGVTRLLADRDDPPLLVLTDAGRGPFLADRLLGTDQGSVRRRLGAAGGCRRGSRIGRSTAGGACWHRPCRPWPRPRSTRRSTSSRRRGHCCR